MTPEITHIIFDNDGLLLDTEPFYTKAHQAVASRFGKTFDWTVKSKMIGLRAEDSAKIMIEALSLPLTVPEYLKARKHLLEEQFPDAQPLPGAVRLTRHLHSAGIPQAVATSSDRRHFELKITKHQDWFSLFDCILTGDDPAIRRGKPAPDIFLIAAGRLNADPRHCLVFEDSPAGVEAARTAGMFVVAVPDMNMSEAAYAGAHQVIRNLNDLELSLWGLPPFPEN
ncbi:MAG TPA: HAD-IA family hydrolase [Acidobacteriota bacterium]|nr:HAD-IA family hydrolase [Acidobacteriota bacterium]